MTLELREAEQFLLSLNAAWKNLGLYSPTHPAATAAFEKLTNAFETLVGSRDRITFGVLHGTLILNRLPLTAKPDLFRTLLTRLQNGEIQGITLLKGCTMDELRHLVELLGQNVKRTEFEEELKKRDVTRIILAQLAQDGTEEQRKPGGVDERVGAGAIYNRALQTTRKVFQELRLGKVPSLGEVQRTVEDLVGGILKAKQSLMALTMIKSYDEYLFNHSVNVGILTIALGETLGLDGKALRELGLGALLHDVGKVNIPEEITRAPRKLTDEEFEIIKRHPLDGVKILEDMGVQSEVTLRVTKEHHVDFDGRGYPRLGPDEQPHSYSMIVHVADTYDAMTTVRVYSGAVDPNQAISRMKKLTGTAFNPLTVDKFVEMLGIYPPGTAVRLTTGEIGVVTRPGSEDVSRPWVQIVHDREGNAVDREQVSLMEWDPLAEDYARSIVIAIDPVIRRIDVAKILKVAKLGG